MYEHSYENILKVSSEKSCRKGAINANNVFGNDRFHYLLALLLTDPGYEQQKTKLLRTELTNTIRHFHLNLIKPRLAETYFWNESFIQATGNGYSG